MNVKLELNKLSTFIDEFIVGNKMDASDITLNMEDVLAAMKEPYGNVPYADPGYTYKSRLELHQSGKKCRSIWSGPSGKNKSENNFRLEK